MSVLTDNFYSEADKLFSEYPRRANALLPLLHLVQKERGYVCGESMKEVARLCDVSLNHVEGVVTFYTMYAREKRGKCYLGVCTNISCYIRGGVELLEHIENKLGIHSGESTPDGKFFLEEVECLGACGFAPVMMVDEEYHENLSAADADRIIEENSKD